MLTGNHEDRKSQRRLEAQRDGVCETPSSLRAPHRRAVLVTSIATTVTAVLITGMAVSQIHVPRTIPDSGLRLNPDSR